MMMMMMIVRSLILLHLCVCVYVNQAALVNLILINESDDNHLAPLRDVDVDAH